MRNFESLVTSDPRREKSQAGRCPTAQRLVFVDFVLRAAGENLLLAPGGYVLERLAVDEIEEGLFLGPLARDEVRGVVADILPKRGVGVALRRAERTHDRRKLVFKVLLLAWNHVIVHANGNHGGGSPEDAQARNACGEEKMNARRDCRRRGEQRLAGCLRTGELAMFAVRTATMDSDDG